MVCTIIRTNAHIPVFCLSPAHRFCTKIRIKSIVETASSEILYGNSYKNCPRRSYLDVFVRNFVQALPPKGPTRWFYTVFRTNALTQASFTLVYTKFRINDAVEGASSNML